MIYQYNEKGQEIGRYNNLDQVVPLFLNEKRTPSAIKSNISQSYNSYRSKAYGFYWKNDKQKKHNERKTYFKNYDSLVKSELRVMSLSVSKSTKNYKIYCFEKKQAINLCERISKSMWNVDWYFNLIDKIYVVECSR